MSYADIYNRFLRRLNTKNAPLSYTELRELKNQLLELQQAAQDELQSPTNSILEAYKKLARAVPESNAANNKAFEESGAEIENIEQSSFVDPITPQMDLTVQALTFRYINEINRAGGDTFKIQSVGNKALSTREGAMALLRLPQEYISEGTKNPVEPKKISRIYIDRAIEKSQSPEKLLFESRKKYNLEAAGKKQVEIFQEGFKIRTLEKSLEQSIVSLQGKAARENGTASFFKY